ncbi:phage gp6-like head-tail connector family protein [Burkholderia pseudomallei MSHR733]|uniref:head-tail connector protein n=1 Tax=Burkholderia pseudomallei TaxID=28450 RepID=UPI00053792D5|nr:head-tail connector protein [Burkholderia pseudomallei]KGW27083.1 phage gp6-like head-tail connector family protein [Burkholderia pseudomallei MSHR733]
MAAGDLTTLANAKQWLNVPSTVTGDDAMLTRLVSAASQFVQTYLNRTIASTAYTEKHTGSGSNTLALPNYPITAVSSLAIRGVPIAASPDGVQVGYTFDDRFLYLIGNVGFSSFPNGTDGHFPKWPPLGVQVSYTAGFASTPFDIEQAVLELIGLKYAGDRTHFGQVSKTVNGEVVSFSMADMPASVKTLLNNYRKVIPV